jgi:hypothetical protein
VTAIGKPAGGVVPAALVTLAKLPLTPPVALTKLREPLP